MPSPSSSTLAGAAAELQLLSWRRETFALYLDVRRSPDPAAAWAAWREGRDRLFRDHPQTPLEPGTADSFGGLEYFGYDPALRTSAAVELEQERPLRLTVSSGEPIAFRRFARAVFSLSGTACELPLYWLEGYAGGLFLPFADGTSGDLTFGAGRYLLDTAKGADLGITEGRLVLDFNFAYNPSCAYRESWSCPLPPAESGLPVDVRAGELVPRSRH
jgi:uncharacterized protein (DUF1684 family)